MGKAQNGTIKGTVYGVENVLTNASVAMGNKSLLTNERGEFSFSTEPGVYILVVIHTGYKKIEKEIILEADSICTVDISLIPVEQLDEVVVLGSRSASQRTNLNTAVPVDAFSSKQLLQTGQPALVQMLNYLIPSFTTSRQVSNEPVTLRGLDPDHVLILLNGTRYHNLAWLNQGNNRGPLGRGSVGNDLNAIPFSAIEKIEVLRDGASSQYGSDAIAGVINIRLKESTGKTSLQFHSGQYYKGDGSNFTVGINRGFSLNKKGFLNFSGDFRLQNRTNRGGMHEGTVYYNIPAIASPAQQNTLIAQDNKRIEERKFNRYIPASHVGNPWLASYGVLINGGYPINNHTEIFLTGAINNRNVNSRGAYRFPKSINQVDTALFPDGFQVRIITNTLDISGIVGVRNKTKNNWQMEFSSSFGYNAVTNFAENTNNASLSFLGKNAPTIFYTGKLAYNQLINNIAFSKTFKQLPASIKKLNLGFGAEWRLENYHSFPGEESSWKNYDTINKKLNGGAQGASGISPDDIVNKSRNVEGLYFDIESELNNRILLDLSGRYEYYSDFGGNLAGKLAVRYKLSDKFSLRGSISNGFRAPGLQQRFQSATLTTWARTGGTTVAAIRGIFPENHAIASALHIPSLTAEKSINASAGFTTTFLSHISMTVDVYMIEIKNRIILTGLLDRAINPSLDRILDSYPDLNQVDQIQFFINSINTKTKGADIVLNGKWNNPKTNFGFMLAANFNNTHIFGRIKTGNQLMVDSLDMNSLFTIEERARVEKGQPDSKIILLLTYKRGKTGLCISNTRFGNTASATIYTNPDKVLTENYTSKILTDISINYSFKKAFIITVGANNIFNINPSKLKYTEDRKEGILIYSQEASPFGYNGGYYFIGLDLTW